MSASTFRRSSAFQAFVLGFLGFVCLPFVFYLKLDLKLPDRWSGTALILAGLSTIPLSYWLACRKAQRDSIVAPEARIDEFEASAIMAEDFRQLSIARKAWLLGLGIGSVLYLASIEFGVLGENHHFITTAPMLLMVSGLLLLGILESINSLAMLQVTVLQRLHNNPTTYRAMRGVAWLVFGAGLVWELARLSF